MSTPRNKPLALPVRPVDTAACLTPDTNSARSFSKTHLVSFSSPASQKVSQFRDLFPPLAEGDSSLCSCWFVNNKFVSAITESTDSGSASVKKEKEKKNRKKDKENGSGSGEAGNHDNFDAPEAVVGFVECHCGSTEQTE